MLNKFCTFMWEWRFATTGLAIGAPLPLIFGLTPDAFTWAWIGLCNTLCGISWFSIWPLLCAGKK